MGGQFPVRAPSSPSTLLPQQRQGAENQCPGYALSPSYTWCSSLGFFNTEWNWSGSGEPVLSNILLLWTVEPLHADTSLCDARTGFYTLEIADYIMRRSSRHMHAAIHCLEHVLPMKYAGLVSRHKNSPEWRLTALATMYCTSSKTKLKSWPARPCQKGLRS